MWRTIVCFLILVTTSFGQLIFSDEFDGDRLDKSKWEIVFPGKRLDAINVERAVRVEDGCLKIQALTFAGKHFTAMVGTKHSFKRASGYFEARMKFSDNCGTWSDFWLYSDEVANGNGIEIDVVEHRTFGKDYKWIAPDAEHCLHWGGYGDKHQYDGTHVYDVGAEDFHVYSVEWKDDLYKFYIDDKPTFVGKAPKFTEPLWLIFSTEIDGSGWSGQIPAEGYHQDTLCVDYVRVYETKPDPTDWKSLCCRQLLENAHLYDENQTLRAEGSKIFWQLWELTGEDPDIVDPFTPSWDR